MGSDFVNRYEILKFLPTLIWYQISWQYEDFLKSNKNFGYLRIDNPLNQGMVYHFEMDYPLN